MTNKIGIVAFAFGTPENIPSNICIARNTMEEAKKFDAPVYTQRDIDIKEDGLDTTYTEETPNYPPPTLRIARGAIQWAKKRGIENLIIIAAEPHIWRAIRDVKQAVRETGLQIKIRPSTWNHRKNFLWFYNNSTQKRTQSWWQWWSREIIARLLPFWLYKIIAS